MVSRSISALLELAAEVEAQDDSVDSGSDSDDDDNKNEAGNGGGNNARFRLTMPQLPPAPGPLAPITH